MCAVYSEFPKLSVVCVLCGALQSFTATAPAPVTASFSASEPTATTTPAAAIAGTFKHITTADIMQTMSHDSRVYPAFVQPPPSPPPPLPPPPPPPKAGFASSTVHVDEQEADFVITEAHLHASHPQYTDAQLVFTVLILPGEGDLELSGATLSVNDTFTQEDVSSSLLTYSHTVDKADDAGHFH